MLNSPFGYEPLQRGAGLNYLTNANEQLMNFLTQRNVMQQKIQEQNQPRGIGRVYETELPFETEKRRQQQLDMRKEQERQMAAYNRPAYEYNTFIDTTLPERTIPNQSGEYVPANRTYKEGVDYTFVEDETLPKKENNKK